MGKSGQIEPDWSPFIAYASRKRNFNWPDCVVIVFLIGFAFFIWMRISNLPGYDWNWSLLEEFLLRRNKNGNLEPGLLLTGLFTTIRAGFWVFVFSLVLGLFLAAISTRKLWLSKFLCQIYINFIRNTPPLILLFCVYFFAGNILPVGWLEDFLRASPNWLRSGFANIFASPGQIDRMLAAVIALGCYQGAYVAEILRAGLESVPTQQWDAALALGFTRYQTLRLVILPQALKFILPPLTGQAITTFKDTALVSLISLPDLTFQSLEIMAISNMTFEIWISTALLYLGIGLVCALAGYFFERRFHY